MLTVKCLAISNRIHNSVFNKINKHLLKRLIHRHHSIYNNITKIVSFSNKTFNFIEKSDKVLCVNLVRSGS